MPNAKVSIKWPTVASINKRLRGLREIEERIVKSRPEPYYGKFEGTWLKRKMLVPPKSNTVEGKKWMEMRLAIGVLTNETQELLTLTRQVQREAKKNVTAVPLAGK